MPQTGFEPVKVHVLNVVAVPICIYHRGKEAALGARGGIRTLNIYDLNVARLPDCATRAIIMHDLLDQKSS